MTPIKLTFGLAGLALVFSAWSGCYFARDRMDLPEDEALPTYDLDGDGVSAPGDCNDHDADVYPGAPEVCDNGVDDDCDGKADDVDPDCTCVAVSICDGPVDPNTCGCVDGEIVTILDRPYVCQGNCYVQDDGMGGAGGTGVGGMGGGGGSAGGAAAGGSSSGGSNSGGSNSGGSSSGGSSAGGAGGS
jgi:hypothetical protein